MNLAELQEEETLIRAQLKKNLDEQNELKISKWIAKYKINVGDKIQYPVALQLRTGTLKRFKVSSLVWPIVVLDKKDGTPGVQEKLICNSDTLIKIN